MKKAVAFLALFIITTTFSNALWAGGTRVVVRPFAAVRFAALPEGVHFPEGITVNPYNGDIYVSTFDFGGNNNQLLRYNKVGRLEETLFFSTTPLLGLAFNKLDNKVYIANIGASAIQRVDANFDSTTVVETVAMGFSGPNGMVFDSAGNLFVSDSFAGSISRIDSPHTCAPPPCSVVLVASSTMLQTTGFPPFGANGLAFGNAESMLYVANTGDDRVLTVDVITGDVSPFVESINGADGLAVDKDGYLWVAANQADQIVALDGNGKVVAELSEFLGIRPDGSVRGTLFPASIVIVGRKMFVTNLAFPLLGDRVNGSPTEPEADVTKDTISRINIPRL